jgi:hypothetical protein
MPPQRNRLLPPRQIAQYVRDELFEDQDGQLTWIAKHFLLGRTSELLPDGNRGLVRPAPARPLRGTSW